MADLSFDLAVTQAMAGELETYLQRDVLYWQMDAHGPYSHRFPRLTIGGLLLRLRRLNALRDRLTPAQNMDLDAVNRRFETVVGTWPAAYDRKLQAEIKARLDAWARYLAEDCADGRPVCAEEYPSQAEVRTILALLLEEAARVSRGDLAPLQSRLAALDGQLRRLFRPGPFIWNAALAPAYPPDRFWWLYLAVAR